MGAFLHRLREMSIFMEKQALPSLSAQMCLAALKDYCQVCCSPFYDVCNRYHLLVILVCLWAKDASLWLCQRCRRSMAVLLVPLDIF